MSANIIICADDFALDRQVNQAILQLIELGCLSATACMTESPEWELAARSITPAHRQLASIGLHLDLTEFGKLMPLKSLVIHALARTLNRKRIRAIIEKQLSLFEDAMDCAPDYIDGHQHIHQLPQIRDELLETITCRYPVRPWIRISQPDLSAGIKGSVIGMLGATSLRRRATESGCSTTGPLLGVYDFEGGKHQYARALESWLERCRLLSGTSSPVLMCHPACDGNNHHADPIRQARIAEYQVLSQIDLPYRLMQKKLRLLKNPDHGNE